MERMNKKDAFPGNILVMENLLVDKKRNILYDDTIYPCDEFVWLKYDDGVTSPCTTNRQMRKWVDELYIYVKNLDRQKPFYSMKTDIYINTG